MMRSVGRLLVLAAHSWVAVLAAAEDDAAVRMAAWKSGSDKVWSYDVVASNKVDAYSRPHKHLIPVGDHVVRQRFSRGMWRVDLLSTRRMFSDGRVEEWKAPRDDAGGGRAFAYSGKGVVRFFSPDQSFAQVMPVVEYSPIKVLGPQLFEVFKADPRGTSYFELSAPRIQEAHVKASSSIVTLRMSGSQDGLQPGTNIGFEIQLNAACNHLPVQVRQSADLSEDPPYFFRVIDNTLAEVRPQVWCPTKVTERVFAKGYRDTDLEPAGITVVEVDLSNSHFNIDIPRELFELRFPSNTVVYDASTGENYVDALHGGRDYAAYRRKVIDQVESQAEAPASTSTPSSAVVWVVLVNLALVVAISALAVMRRSTIA